MSIFPNHNVLDFERGPYDPAAFAANWPVPRELKMAMIPKLP